MLGVERWIADVVGGQRMSGAVLPAGVQGAEPLLEAFRPARSWSIIAFCVMVKAFSRILKCKNQGIMYNLMSLRLRMRNHPSLQRYFSGMPLISVPI